MAPRLFGDLTQECAECIARPAMLTFSTSFQQVSLASCAAAPSLLGEDSVCLLFRHGDFSMLEVRLRSPALSLGSEL